MQSKLRKFFLKHKILFLSILIFLFALSLRTWNLGKAGQVWDEDSLLVNYAYRHFEDALNLDFGSEFWWKGTPDHPPLVRYMRIIAAIPDMEGFENGKPIYSYDLFYNRILSVVLTSLTAILVFLIGKRYVSLYTGLVAAIIYSMLPIPLGHSQIAMLEALALFFFPLSMFTFFVYLEKPTNKTLLLAGISLGLALLARETHLMLLPMFLIIMWLKNKYAKKKNLLKLFKKTLLIFLISFLTFFIFWPMPFFHLDYIIKYTLELRASTTTSIPEVFFGFLMFVPPGYQAVYFLITTPLIIMILGLFGLKKMDKSYNWVWYSLILWFLFPFILSLYPNRQQGIRYIIQIVIPFAIIAALGFETLVDKLTKNKAYKWLLIIPLFLYQFVILLRITPYYIDYFNVLVGGAKNVYEKKLFHLAWWGEGSLEAMNYIRDNAKQKTTVGLATTPLHTFPKYAGIVTEEYQEDKKYDFVIVNFYNIVRIGFDDSYIRKNYVRVYSVMADGARLYDVYKKK